MLRDTHALWLEINYSHDVSGFNKSNDCVTINNWWNGIVTIIIIIYDYNIIIILLTENVHVQFVGFVLPRYNAELGYTSHVLTSWWSLNVKYMYMLHDNVCRVTVAKQRRYNKVCKTLYCVERMFCWFDC